MKIIKNQNRKKEDWIKKDFESKIPKLDRTKIFIPCQKNLPF